MDSVETKKMKAIDKKWWGWLFAVIVVFGITASGCGKGGGSSSSDDGLSMAGFTSITDGMDKAQVDKIAHSSGEMQQSAGSGQYKMESYKYNGNDGSMSFAIISFTAGSVSAKTQVGLK
jgi:hypothetical protein